MERVESGVLALGTVTDASVKVNPPPAIDWQLAAEFTALVVRQMLIPPAWLTSWRRHWSRAPEAAAQDFNPEASRWHVDP